MRGGAPLQLGARPVEKEGAAEAGVLTGDHCAQEWNAGSARMRSCPDKPSGRMTGRCAGTPRLAAKIAAAFRRGGWPCSPHAARRTPAGRRSASSRVLLVLRRKARAIARSVTVSTSSQVQPNVLATSANSLRHRHPAHQPVVGVEGDGEAEPVQPVDRVRGQRRVGAGLHVRRRRDLEGHLLVAHPLRQRAEGAVVGDLVGDPHTVAEPLGVRRRRGRRGCSRCRRPRPRGWSGGPRRRRGCRWPTGCGPGGTRPRGRRGRSRRRPGRGTARPARPPRPSGRSGAWRTAAHPPGSECPPRWPPARPRRSRRPSPRRPRRSSAPPRSRAPARTAPRRRRRRPRRGRGRTPARPGGSPRASASPRRCARTSRGTSPASRSRPHPGTSGPGRRRRRRAVRGGRPRRRARGSSRPQPAVQVVVQEHLGRAGERLGGQREGTRAR